MADDKDLALEAATALGAVVPEAYRDLLQPSAQELGRGLLLVAKAVNMALSPLGATVWGFEQIKDWLLATLTKKLSGVEPGDIVTPSKQIAGQVLVNLRFVEEEEELRDMYSSLLASAMDRNLRSKAHPAFATVIQQLSPEEAKILSELAKQPRDALIWSEQSEEGVAKSQSIESAWLELFKVAGVGVTDQDSKSFLDNLLRLRLLTVDLHSTARFETRTSFFDDGHEVTLREGSVREMYLTDFGARFLESCVSAREYGDHSDSNDA
jgi:hypothetical protein